MVIYICNASHPTTGLKPKNHVVQEIYLLVNVFFIDVILKYCKSEEDEERINKLCHRSEEGKICLVYSVQFGPSWSTLVLLGCFYDYNYSDLCTCMPLPIFFPNVGM